MHWHCSPQLISSMGYLCLCNCSFSLSPHPFQLTLPDSPSCSLTERMTGENLRTPAQTPGQCPLSRRLTEAADPPLGWLPFQALVRSSGWWSCSFCQILGSERQLGHYGQLDWRGTASSAGSSMIFSCLDLHFQSHWNCTVGFECSGSALCQQYERLLRKILHVNRPR